MNFNFFKRNKNLQNNIENIDITYNKLISNIKKLGITYEQEFNVYAESLDKNYYAIIIDFSGKKNSTIRYFDTFTLVKKSNGLNIIWKRTSASLLSILPLFIPEKIEFVFKFDNLKDEDEMFKILLNNIVEQLSKKYKFSDSYYKDIIKNGLVTFTQKDNDEQNRNLTYDNEN